MKILASNLMLMWPKGNRNIMRIKPLYALLVLLAFFSCREGDKNTPIDSNPYLVILVAGQSNTNAGFGLDPAIDLPEQGIMQFGRFDDHDRKIIAAVEPLQHHTAKENKIGFALTFSKLVKKHFNDDRELLIVPCGYGGSGFQNNRWNKGDDLYTDAVDRVQSILLRNKESRLLAILWHQGEKDIDNSNYQDSLDDFITNIREDLNAQNVPFIVGGMVPFWVAKEERRQRIQHIIKNTIERHDFIGYADPELPFIIEKKDNSFDPIHYNAAGQRELGKRYFAEFERLLK